jgi:nitrite reductase/ring-hydroxylating ferredoxin subunit
MGAEADTPADGAKCVTVNDGEYALFKVGAKIYCLDNTCTHAGGPLCEGDLDGFVVTCPWHGSQFDVRSGQVVGPPARTPVRSYPATVEGGRVWVELP